ncbi:hypothetical protein, partial [Klebsiella pneumoniae]|uniref:hypothetical protein n=1 Tax=Klebsiella pneumoniae TaxID=573 RepID=UPI0021E1F6E4
ASVVVANHHKLLDTSYRVKFPGVAEIVDEHPPKRQQQAAAAKAPGNHALYVVNAVKPAHRG